MIRAVIFDKDGTLFDFQATWGAWAETMLTELAGPDQILLHRLSRALGYDLKTRRFRPDSFVIADTAEAVAVVLAAEMPGHRPEDILDRLNAAAAEAPLVEAAPLVPLLLELQRRGLGLGVVTNDAEAPARAHLAEAGVLDAFDFIAGYDSGFGAKPAPQPLLAFARALGLPPSDIVMVGDSTHDLKAGRAAGMATLGVLTGPAEAPELAPWADAILPHVGHLPEWLDRRTRP
jgi:phosphoglycolate phosphatase